MFHIIFDGVKITKSSLRIINLKDEIFMTHTRRWNICVVRDALSLNTSVPHYHL